MIISIGTGGDIGNFAEEAGANYPLVDWLHFDEPGNCDPNESGSLDLLKIVASASEADGGESRRIYLFATGRSANIALQLLAKQSSRLSGIGILNGCCQDVDEVLAPTNKLRHRAFLAGSTGNSNLQGTLKLGRLLHSFGMHITTKLYAASSLDAKLSDFINWIGVSAAE